MASSTDLSSKQGPEEKAVKCRGQLTGNEIVLLQRDLFKMVHLCAQLARSPNAFISSAIGCDENTSYYGPTTKFVFLKPARAPLT